MEVRQCRCRSSPAFPSPICRRRSNRSIACGGISADRALYIKRDDCTGLALGGNKTRKAEFLIGAARAAGATAVITEGGLQSNHVRQTAAAAAKAGLACHLVLNRNVPIETAIYQENGNMLLDRVLGASVHVCVPGQSRADAIARLLPALKKDGAVPYVIPTGGSNEIGALGYAAAALELQQQAKEAGIAIDRVLFATASGGTQAGLVAGMALAEAGTQVLGIDVENEADSLLAEVRRIAEACAASVGVKRALRNDAFEIRSGYARRRLRHPDARHDRSGRPAGAAGGNRARPGL